MLKLLLALDDYQEAQDLNSLLKKVGFSIEIISNEASFSQMFLGFGPDVIIAGGKSKKLSAINIAKKVKENQKMSTKLILLLSESTKIQPSELAQIRVDAFMESPISPEKLIDTICRLTGHGSQVILEKYRKHVGAGPVGGSSQEVQSTATSQTTPSVEQVPFSFSGPSSSAPVAPLPIPTAAQNKARVEKYSHYVQGSEKLDLSQSSLKRTDVKRAQKELQKDWDMKSLESLDEEKRKFVQALFKK